MPSPASVRPRRRFLEFLELCLIVERAVGKLHLFALSHGSRQRREQIVHCASHLICPIGQFRLILQGLDQHSCFGRGDFRHPLQDLPALFAGLREEEKHPQLPHGLTRFAGHGFDHSGEKHRPRVPALRRRLRGHFIKARPAPAPSQAGGQ